MNKILTLLVLGIASLTLNAAYAHGNMKPKHGGIMQMVGETSFELVAGAEATELYVVDDGEDISSADMTARLTITNGGASSEAAMQPAGGNRFEARGVKIASGSKVVVLLTDKDKSSKVRANFTVK